MGINAKTVIIGDAVFSKVSNRAGDEPQSVTTVTEQTTLSGPLKVTKDFLVEKESDYLQHNRKT